MVGIIHFIRNNKTTNIEDLLEVIKQYDTTIITSSIHIALVKLFENHFESLNERRLYEYLKWINSMFAKMEPGRNTEINMSRIRSMIKKKYGPSSEQYKKSQVHLLYDRAEKAKQIEDYNTKVYERCNNQSPIYMSVVNRLMTYKDSDDWKKKVIYLLLSSGSRMKEIVVDGKFSPDPDNENNILLSNIAKSTSSTREISKPILGDRSDFLRILEEVRGMNLILGSTNILVNKELNNDIGDSSYALRRWYATLTYELLADTNKISKTCWLGSVLGHDKENQETAICYQNYYVEHDEYTQVEEPVQDTCFSRFRRSLYVILHIPSSWVSAKKIYKEYFCSD